ncbi:MAG: hypothetical protein ACI9G1_004461, partial [Pirellulaceae bacterium]
SMLFCVTIFASLVFLLNADTHAEEITITHGPILGRLSKDGVGVWARTSKPGQFRVAY